MNLEEIKGRKLTNEEYTKLENYINNYPSKYEQGLIWNEQNEILSKFPHINIEKFNDALNGISCQSINGEIVIYRCDIIPAIVCGIENRDLVAIEID